MIKCWRDKVSVLALGYNLVKCDLHSCHHLLNMKTLEWVKISVFISGFVTTFICEQHTKDASNWYLSLQQTGHAALMLAAKAGHLNVVKKLITNGASLDITDKVNSLSTAGMHTQHVAILCRLSVNYCLSQFHVLDLYWFGKHLLVKQLQHSM